MKNIIVEGPDGSGKSTLIDHLRRVLGFSIHDRAVTSKDGPIMPLAKWVDEDISANWDHPWIYDRYPTISEPIYGKEVRRGNIESPFDNQAYLMNVNDVLYATSVVVWCLPSLATVRNNVLDNRADQMPGVVRNIAHVHQAYMTAYFRWRGPKLRYDYNHHDLFLITDNIRKAVTK